MKEKRVDRLFLTIVLLLTGVGVVSFISASLGVLAKSETKFYSVLVSQLVVGLVGGGIALLAGMKIHYTFWRKYSFYFLLGAMVLTLLVFVPGVGFTHGGATRWIDLKFVSFQPAEFLKVAFVIYFASWLSWAKQRVDTVRYGLLPFFGLLGVIAVILLKQPDTKSLMLMFAAGASMYFITGVNLKKIVVAGSVAVVIFIGLALSTPYLRDRLNTFLHPNNDPRGSSYQLQQALIAVGSGGVSGRGLGQSVQKFNYLPEPQGDSIFAVISEEFGFVGAAFVVLLYVAFAFRGLRIAGRAPDSFGRLLGTGIVILLTAQSFLNIASIIGLFPLTGVPLVFMSHGGTALMVALGAVGIVLNISKFKKI